MGSETGAKWVIVILLYFVVMIFLVSLINLTSVASLDTSIDSTTAGVGCGSPRYIYDEFQLAEENYEPYTQEYIATKGTNWRDYYASNIMCHNSIGVLSEDVCETLDGCVWESQGGFFGLGGITSCWEEMNYTFINETIEGTQWTVGSGELMIADYRDTGNSVADHFICEHPSVINNQTLCQDLSCTWKYRNSVENYDSIFEGFNVEPSLTMMGSVWEVSKDMFSFRFDFGFDNALANFMLYFLIFWLPLIGLAFGFYVMVRS